MAVGLHAELKKKLVTDLSAIIPNLHVVKGISVTHDTRDLLLPLDQSLPGHGGIRERLSAWISDRPVSDFVVGSINFEMMQFEFAAESVPLSEIEGWNDAVAQAQRLVDELDALPNTYVVSTPAPDGMAPYLEANKGNITLAKKLRFAVADKDFVKTYPVSTGNQKLDNELWDIGILNLLGDGPRYEWKGAYTQLVVRGFIGRFLETNTEHNIVGDFKALWGATLALQITERRRTWSQFSPKKKLIVHVYKSNGLELVPRIELDAKTSQLVEDIKFNDWAPDDQTTEAKAGIYSLYIRNLESLFGEGDESSRLRLAARWLFDSYATDNQLLAYVQAMVCLEIILGDSSLIGEISLGELLRNRCAYLIGTTSKQRSEILSEFKEIYDVRSHIVHRGKDRMTARERLLYHKLIWYCSRCLNEELSLIKKTNEENAKNALAA